MVRKSRYDCGPIVRELVLPWLQRLLGTTERMTRVSTLLTEDKRGDDCEVRWSCCCHQLYQGGLYDKASAFVVQSSLLHIRGIVNRATTLLVTEVPTAMSYCLKAMTVTALMLLDEVEYYALYSAASFTEDVISLMRLVVQVTIPSEHPTMRLVAKGKKRTVDSFENRRLLYPDD